MEIRMSLSDYEEGYDNGVGICTHCGVMTCENTIEPDGTHGLCENCGHHDVMGLENALLEDLITFTEEE